MPKYYKFSWKITIIGLSLITLFLRLSYWQWERHLEKKILVNELEQRVIIPAIELKSNLQEIQKDVNKYVNRRFIVSGDYDFSQEVYIKNRSLDGKPGVLALTPLKLSDGNQAIFISRGFIPLSTDKEKSYQKYKTQASVQAIGLLKDSSARKMFAPQDPPTSLDKPRVSEFLRIDIQHISKQLPYEVLPFYLELMPDVDVEKMSGQIVKGDSDKEELLLMPLRGLKNKSNNIDSDNAELVPIPMFSNIVPAVRHLGYVFEWAIMALVTALICLVLQLKKVQ